MTRKTRRTRLLDYLTLFLLTISALAGVYCNPSRKPAQRETSTRLVKGRAHDENGGYAANEQGELEVRYPRRSRWEDCNVTWEIVGASPGLTLEEEPDGLFRISGNFPPDQRNVLKTVELKQTAGPCTDPRREGEDTTVFAVWFNVDDN